MGSGGGSRKSNFLNDVFYEQPPNPTKRKCHACWLVSVTSLHCLLLVEQRKDTSMFLHDDACPQSIKNGRHSLITCYRKYFVKQTPFLCIAQTTYFKPWWKFFCKYLCTQHFMLRYNAAAWTHRRFSPFVYWCRNDENEASSYNQSLSLATSLHSVFCRC